MRSEAGRGDLNFGYKDNMLAWNLFDKLLEEQGTPTNLSNDASYRTLLIILGTALAIEDKQIFSKVLLMIN